MTTNAPGQVFPARPLVDASLQSRTALESVLHRVQTWMCGLHGHDSVLQYERTRMFLRCTSCGHETPGWEVVPPHSVPRLRTETRSSFAAPDLHVARKIA
jgi:hypothetical protein